MRRLGGHVALVVSLAALVVALGGTALAASYVITSSSQIKDGAVASAEVKNGSLTGADVKDRSLSPSDFNGSVTGPPGPQGAVEPCGPPGSAAEDGAYKVSLGGAEWTTIIPTVVNVGPEGVVVATAEVVFEPYMEYLSMAFVNVEGDGRVTCTFAEASGGASSDSFVAHVGQVGIFGTTLEAPERFTGTLVTDYPAPLASGGDRRFRLTARTRTNSRRPPRSSSRGALLRSTSGSTERDLRLERTGRRSGGRYTIGHPSSRPPHP